MDREVEALVWCEVASSEADARRVERLADARARARRHQRRRAELASDNQRARLERCLDKLSRLRVRRARLEGRPAMERRSIAASALRVLWWACLFVMWGVAFCSAAGAVEALLMFAMPLVAAMHKAVAGDAR